jgi:hypothetical protein
LALYEYAMNYKLIVVFEIVILSAVAVGAYADCVAGEDPCNMTTTCHMKYDQTALKFKEEATE